MKTSEVIQRALEEKWYPLLRGEPIEGCYLCAVYVDCPECPVFKDTGQKTCVGTPYRSWLVLHHIENLDLHAEVTAAAQWEIDYLEQLKEKYENAND